MTSQTNQIASFFSFLNDNAGDETGQFNGWQTQIVVQSDPADYRNRERFRLLWIGNGSPKQAVAGGERLWGAGDGVMFNDAAENNLANYERFAAWIQSAVEAGNMRIERFSPIPWRGW